MALLTIAAVLTALQLQFVAKPCADPRTAQSATCGTVGVLEDRAKPDGRRIGLNIDTADLKAVDPTCVASMKPPPFATGAKP